MTFRNAFKSNDATRGNERFLSWGVCCLAASVVMSLVGCQNLIKRGQSPEANSISQLYEDKETTTKYIGDLCGIYGLNFAKVEGVGLAYGLDRTGSSAKPNVQRDLVLKSLSSNSSIDNPSKLIASLDTEIVVIKGMLPPGIRKGEYYDLEVVTVGGSEAKSLENGMILQTRMQPMARLGGGLKQGRATGYGKGRILVDALYESEQDPSNRLRGVVLGGGRAKVDRPLGLKVREDTVPASTSMRIARAINDRFDTDDVTGKKGVAEPKTNRDIVLLVPENYRQNIGRYLGVIKNIAYSESASDRVNRLETLEREIGEPTKSGLAAIRLEALGADGVPALKRALRHHDLEVQFHAAQSLAFMEHDDGVDILKKAAAEEPAFRWNALTALASLNDVSASIALADLLNLQSAETRYGAFRALRAQSPNDSLVDGDWLASDFFLHVVPSEAEPLLHFSRSKRPEIIVFGTNQTVADNFLHVETGLTVRANGNGTVSVSRYTTDEKEKKVCSNRIGDLVKTLADMGYGYGPQMKMFRAAKKSEMLNTRLVVNAVPKLGREYSPDGDEIPAEKSEKYVAEALPELFRTGNERVTSVPRVEEETVGEIEAEIKSKNDSNWGKMLNWFTDSEE